MSSPAPVIRITDPADALFASDMHLDDEEPGLCRHFLSTLEQRLAKSRPASCALFLLGDLFEYWVGDDTPSPVAAQLAGMLHDFVARGGRCFLMHGNRDFLIDATLPGVTASPGYSQRCSATLLPDPAVIMVGGQRIVLSHGDVLCTSDLPYQQWRQQCRQPAWQTALLAQPIADRLALARSLRTQSQQHQAAPENLADAEQDAIDRMMDETGCALMIHGHTHRPALHAWQHASGARRRWVLSDWSADRGQIMSLAEGLSLQPC